MWSGPHAPWRRCPLTPLFDAAWNWFARKVLPQVDANLAPVSDDDPTVLLIDCEGRPLGHPKFCVTCELEHARVPR